MDITERQLLPFSWQQASWDRLHQQQKEGRFPHAILLQGVVDSGLDRFSILLAHSLLCEKPRDGLSCGNCRSCHLLSVGSHPNFQVIEPGEMESGKLSRVIKIDQIREIMDRVQQTSLQEGRKVLVIYPAEVMNPNAANALLKNLEEPPANTVFILATNNPSRLMATIRSRCQLVDVPLPSIMEADRWLSSFISDDNKREKLLALSGGNPLLVKQWQDKAVIDRLLDLGNELQQLREGRASPLQAAIQWHKQGALLHIVWWWRWLALQVKATTHTPGTAKPLLRFMDKLIVAKSQLESTANPNEQLLLESLLIDWQNLRP